MRPSYELEANQRDYSGENNGTPAPRNVVLPLRAVAPATCARVARGERGVCNVIPTFIKDSDFPELCLQATRAQFCDLEEVFVLYTSLWINQTVRKSYEDYFLLQAQLFEIAIEFWSHSHHHHRRPRRHQTFRMRNHYSLRVCSRMLESLE